MKKVKPTTAGQRGMTKLDFRKQLTKSKPHKGLTKGYTPAQGRDNGRISVRHRGGAHKRKYRDIDFKYDKKDIPAIVESIEYDPNRSSFISLICYRDGERRYVLTPKSVSVGDEIIASEDAQRKAGNRMPLHKLPVGTFVYNVELRPGDGSKLGRSAGTHVEVVAQEGKYTHLKMPSTEIRKVPSKSWASIGSVSNEEHKLIVRGKAGRSRWLGRRPVVRGVAMPASEHVHGGGEGNTGRAIKRPRTKWGKPSGSGQKSRKPKKYSDSMIVSRRRVGKKKK